MTTPDRKQLDDLAKAATIIYVMLDTEETYFLPQTHADNPEIGASEVVILTITRKHLTSVPQALPKGSVYAGVVEYVEGVPV